MDSDNDSYQSENEFYYLDEMSYFVSVKRTSTPGSKMATVKMQHKNCLQSTLQKKICRPRLVRIGKNCALDLEYGPGLRPRAVLNAPAAIFLGGTIYIELEEPDLYCESNSIIIFCEKKLSSSSRCMCQLF